MREIKFRAWDGLKIVNDYTWIDGMGRMCVGWCGHDVELKLMQYTGLKDKNGTEIYEGDAVKYQVGWADTFMGKKQRYVVVIVKDIRSNFEPNMTASIGDVIQCEVIGNIYQNPELLNQK